VSALNRSRSLFLTVSLAVLLPVATGVLWSAVTATRSDDGDDSLYKYLSIFSEAFGLVRSSYVDSPDQDALLGGALDGVGDALDPFSTLVPADAAADYERALDVGSSRSGLLLAKDHGVVFVVAVAPDSPGAKAGLRRGDLVAEIDGEQTRAVPLWRAVRKLAGEPGQAVELRILRDGEPAKHELVLGDFPRAEPTLGEVRGVRVLTIPGFDSATAGRVRALLGEVAAGGAGRLVVDLRRAAGGEADAAYATGALFVRGALGQLARRGVAEREFRSDVEPVWKGQAVVLVDGATLGAGEVLAAILREGAGARLVGLKTFGWAGERGYVELGGGARLHLTTAFYTGPQGHEIGDGLTPDLLVDDLSRHLEERDRPLEELILDRGIDLLLGEDGAPRAS